MTVLEIKWTEKLTFLGSGLPGDPEGGEGGPGKGDQRDEGVCRCTHQGDNGLPVAAPVTRLCTFLFRIQKQVGIHS